MAIFFITLHLGQPHTIFGGFISIFGRWMLSCKEFVVVENSPHITMQCRTFNVALVVLLVSVCCGTVQAKLAGLLVCFSMCVCVCVCVCFPLSLNCMVDTEYRIFIVYE